MVLRIDGRGCQARWLTALALKKPVMTSLPENKRKYGVTKWHTPSERKSTILSPHFYFNLHSIFVCQHQWVSFKMTVSSANIVTRTLRVRLIEITNAKLNYILRWHRPFLNWINLSTLQPLYSYYTFCLKSTEA